MRMVMTAMMVMCRSKYRTRKHHHEQYSGNDFLHEGNRSMTFVS